jgi:hypothetical protein
MGWGLGYYGKPPATENPVRFCGQLPHQSGVRGFRSADRLAWHALVRCPVKQGNEQGRRHRAARRDRGPAHASFSPYRLR